MKLERKRRVDMASRVGELPIKLFSFLEHKF